MRLTLDPRTTKVAVELTNRCNLRCAMCPMGSLGRPFMDMPWTLVTRVAAELQTAGLRAAWLHEMGEPLLYPRLAEAIDLFPGCSISTNGINLDREYATELLATSLERIRCCVDTVNPRVFSHIRRGGIFEEVVANVRSFLELSKGHGIKVEIQKMITLQTSHETVQDFERFFRLDRYPDASVYEKTCEGLDTASATELHEAYHGCIQGHPLRWFVVLADGRVTHCCYDADGRQIIGDMTTQTIPEILSSDKLRETMEAFRSKDWQRLPRCGECYSSCSPRAAVVDHLVQLGHRLDRVLPLKRVARRIINR